MNKENIKKTIENRARDFKNLVIYHTVTRVRHNSFFFENGVFSVKKLLDILSYIKKWETKTPSEQRHEAKRYAYLSAVINNALGIEKDLIYKVLGYYKDEKNKPIRITIDDVMSIINKNQTVIEKINHGTKHKKKVDEKGQIVNETTKSWPNKYLISNNKYWFKLLSDDKYLDIIKYASKRLSKKVLDFYNDKNETVEEDKDTNVKEIEPQAEDTKKTFTEDDVAKFDKKYTLIVSTYNKDKNISATKVNEIVDILNGILGYERYTKVSYDIDTTSELDANMENLRTKLLSKYNIMKCDTDVIL